MKVPRDVVWTRKHKQDCRAIERVCEGMWWTSWGYLKNVRYADTLGRIYKNHPYRGERWWTVVCNDSKCDAEIMVREESILESIDDYLSEEHESET